MLALVQVLVGDHRVVDIPAPYLGRWSLERQFCTGDRGPASILIEKRRINFYERTGYLTLAELNEATDPAMVYGRFEFVANGRFETVTERLEIEGGRLYITENNDPDAPRNKAGWVKC